MDDISKYLESSPEIEPFEDPYQGFDLTIEGIPYTAWDFTVDLAAKELRFSVPAVKKLFKNGLKCPTRCIKIKVPDDAFEGVTRTIIELELIQDPHPTRVAAYSGKLVAVVEYVAYIKSVTYPMAK